MEPTPAYHRAANGHERLVDIGTFVETRPQAAELMEQRQSLLHDVAKDSQAAAVRLSTPGDSRTDVAARQVHPMLLRVIPSVTHHFLGLAQGRARFARDRRDRIYQRNQLRHV